MFGTFNIRVVIVCSCRAVSDRTISAAVAAGASSVGQISATCGAGSDCGGCHRRLQTMLAHLQPVRDSDSVAA
jgi:bacterioferritin-associated ferredoxin